MDQLEQSDPERWRTEVMSFRKVKQGGSVAAVRTFLFSAYCVAFLMCVSSGNGIVM